MTEVLNGRGPAKPGRVTASRPAGSVEIVDGELPSTAAAMIAVIERAAQNPDVDIDKMERLLEMHERILGRSAEMAFNSALQAAQAEMPQILRDARNPQTNSRYARLETVSRTMNPIITRHGFSTSFGTDASPLHDHYRITCELAHAAGHSRRYHADVPADGAGMKGTQNKTATHAFGSTMSYGRRYLKLMIFDVATTDEDDGNTAGANTGNRANGGGSAAEAGPITAKQAKDLEKLIDTVVGELRGNRDRYLHNFLEYMQVGAIGDIPGAEYQHAVDSINSTRPQP